MGKRLRSSYERAQSMVAANRGADSDSFEDINQGKQRSLKMTAGIYVSYFDPNGLGAITKNIEKFSKPVPVLLVIGTDDPFYPESKAMFDSAPANAASRCGIGRSATSLYAGWNSNGCTLPCRQ